MLFGLVETVETTSRQWQSPTAPVRRFKSSSKHGGAMVMHDEGRGHSAAEGSSKKEGLSTGETVSFMMPTLGAHCAWPSLSVHLRLS